MPSFEEQLEKNRAAVQHEQKVRYERAMNILKGLPEWEVFEQIRSSADLKAIIAEFRKLGKVFRRSTWDDSSKKCVLKDEYIVKINDTEVVNFAMGILDSSDNRLFFHYQKDDRGRHLFRSFEELVELIADEIAHDLPNKINAQAFAEYRNNDSIDKLLATWTQL